MLLPALASVELPIHAKAPNLSASLTNALNANNTQTAMAAIKGIATQLITNAKYAMPLLTAQHLQHMSWDLLELEPTQIHALEINVNVVQEQPAHSLRSSALLAPVLSALNHQTASM